MLIYEATKEEFLKDFVNDVLIDKINTPKPFLNVGMGSKGELWSWQNSLQQMYKVLLSDTIPSDVGIAIEFKIPLSSKRIDFVVSGYGEDNRGVVIVIELKQWSGDTTSKIEGKDGLVLTRIAGRTCESLHPSYQAWSYFQLLKNFNESIQEEKILVNPCAYLHNYEQKYKDEIDNKLYAYYVNAAPLFLKGESDKLREFIEKHIIKGDQKKNLYELSDGKIRPSKSLQESISTLMQGNTEFVMIDSQKIVFENALNLALHSIQQPKKSVMIIEGGPGTGKTVVAIQLLAQLLQKGIVTQYISKNSAPRYVYAAKLKGSMRAPEIDHLFRGSGTFEGCKESSINVLIVDEAHRLNEKSGLYRNKGENQIKEIIHTAKCCMFFIDENQKVDIFDIGSKEQIERFAKELGADISYYQLESQFRCNGSDGYLSWLDDLLGIRETANDDGFSMDYEFKIFNDPSEMRQAIELKNKINNKSRIVAGYCWNWPKDSKNNPYLFNIQIGESFRMSWNLGDSKTWAIDKDSIKEAGCIHTCQGLEFDYVGVIVGEDLRFENGKIISDFTKRATTDQSLKGIKQLAKNNPSEAQKIADRIIRNTYRTLMTRGLKGCYVYCCDVQLSEYFRKRLPI